MARAVFNGTVVAASDETVVVEGNHYFPAGSVCREHLVASDVKTSCPWKGEASYSDVVVDGAVAESAAWHYPDPKEAAANIKDHVAFWRGVTVEG